MEILAVFAHDDGFADQQGGQNPHTHRQRHTTIGHTPCQGLVGAFPFDQGGDGQRPCASHDHANAVSGDIGRTHHCLQIDIDGLDAIGIDNDVLRGRGKTKGHRSKGHHGQVLRRVGQAHP